MTDHRTTAPLWSYAKTALITPTTATLAAIASAASLARLALGNFGRTDIYAVALFLAAYPFVEWAAHRFILHSGKFELFGNERMLGVARNHHSHHRDPDNLNKVASETGRNLVLAIFGAAIPFALIFRALRPSVVGVGLVAVGLLTYEVVHGLIHAGYTGKARWFGAIRRHHLRHHFRNENYWFGVASIFADRVLRTNPNPRQVPLSPTARGCSSPDQLD